MSPERGLEFKPYLRHGLWSKAICPGCTHSLHQFRIFMTRLLQSFSKSIGLLPLMAASLFLISNAPMAHCQTKLQENIDKYDDMIAPEKLNVFLSWRSDGKFEKMLFRAMQYTESDRTSKHPLPYLYIAIAYYEIHTCEDDELRVTYEVEKGKALKNALKYAEKFVKKDKAPQVYVPDEFRFFEDLRELVIVEGVAALDEGAWSKSKGWFKGLSNLSDDPGALILVGTSNFAAKSRREATTIWEQAKELLKADSFDFGNLSTEQEKLFETAIIKTCAILYELGEIDLAKEYLELGEPYLSGNREFQSTKRQIGG